MVRVLNRPEYSLVLSSREIENTASISRLTCGWKKPSLSLELVRRYWRDVHSPAIARRAGVHDYRHMALEPVQADLFGPAAGIDFSCAPDAQLMWLSDVRYRDEDALTQFGQSPEPEPRSQLLADIELIVGSSTTYRSVGENARTIVDRTGIPAPQGPSRHAAFSLFFRQRGDEAAFRDCLRRVVAVWVEHPTVLRARLNLFDVPDMEAERAAGYPIKTHPVEQQYQAWMDLVLTDAAAAPALLEAVAALGLAEHVSQLHAYPVSATYTFVFDEAPTLVGLRGYAAYDAIQGLDASNARAPSLLRWMYGPVVGVSPVA